MKMSKGTRDKIKEENKMNKDFELKVIKEGTVDAEGYRYEYVETGDRKEIYRIALKDLDNVFCEFYWELVKAI